MEKYIGVKLISAEPKIKTGNTEDRLKFSSEFQEGYKVVYEDGYTSWSPKDVFEKAYRILENGIPLDKGNWQPHQERVVSEARELRERTDKLEEFIKNNGIFISLVESEQMRLKQQLLAMKYYLTILIERINNF